ncbi:MAG: GxxExxY protein [Candidatus Taylorbacteria bacterium]|nr:GxxExxY protein [Candidatus Taylorbacteria bacterium]
MRENDLIEVHFRLAPPAKAALKKLGIRTIFDLLYHFPVRYGDTSEVRSIASLVHGQTAVVFGKISGLKMSKGFKTKIAMADGWIEDDTGKIKVVWFNQPYLAKMTQEGALVRIEGKVSQRRARQSDATRSTLHASPSLYFSNPKIETVRKLPVGVGDSLFGEKKEEHTLYPVYPESRGITSNWFYHALNKVFSANILEHLHDPIPESIRVKYNLPSIKTALVWIHTPHKQADATSARKRFSFEEVFLIQLEKQRAKKEWQHNQSFRIDCLRGQIRTSTRTDTENPIEKFLERFSFILTNAQLNAIDVILEDFRKGYPMSRLLEGDVGSGKTAVAATTVYAVTTSRPKGQSFGNLQTAYMCPTEILATQHFESFVKYFSHLPIQIALITGSGCRKFPSKVNPDGWTNISRSQLLKWVANGEIPILIGTHALIQKSVKFKNLAYVIIDEQHRFGTHQRQTLVRGQMRTSTPTVADTKPAFSSELLYKDLTYTIRRLVFEVRKELGLGHKESVYQLALVEAFTKNKLVFSREKQIPITYQNKKVGIYIPDFVVDEKIIVELKALPFVGAKEKKQLWHYLKGSSYRLALLVNFANTEATIDRVVYDKRRESESASGQQLSASCPHLLSMTATPIPRTLALTIYGDLDLTLLDEMPAGRKPIKTEIVLPNKREDVYEKIRTELKAGRQLYVICPRIDEPDPDKEAAVIAKSVKEEAKRLKEKVFPEYEIGVLHSKMTPDAKDAEMEKFKEGSIHILCATSVVEVGVNVPNATVIIIEGAERFGLAQLHQLRGRVIRSTDQAYCYVFAETKTQKTLDRLKALKTAKNGFELAEYDLKFRGAGELSGTKQWGISDIAMEALQNLKMVEAARTEASRLIEEDETLSRYPLLAMAVKERGSDIHFE